MDGTINGRTDGRATATTHAGVPCPAPPCIPCLLASLSYSRTRPAPLVIPAGFTRAVAAARLAPPAHRTATENLRTVGVRPRGPLSALSFCLVFCLSSLPLLLSLSPPPPTCSVSGIRQRSHPLDTHSERVLLPCFSPRFLVYFFPEGSFSLPLYFSRARSSATGGFPFQYRA